MPRHLAVPALAFALLLLSCGPPDVPNLYNPGTTIVCLGDSITAGVGANGAPTYPDLLARALGVEVVNLGMPGATAGQGLAALPQALGENPWLVIIELGGNDFLRQVPPAETEAALAATIQGVLEHGAVPLVIEFDAPFADAYREVFDRLEGRFPRVPIVRDVLGKILTTPSEKADPAHPNGAGYQRLAQAVTKRVAPLVKARGGR